MKFKFKKDNSAEKLQPFSSQSFAITVKYMFLSLTLSKTITMNRNRKKPLCFSRIPQNALILHPIVFYKQTTKFFYQKHTIECLYRV